VDKYPFVSSEQVGALYTPNPKPMKIVDGGPAAVSVTVNVAPAVVIVKGWKSLLATPTVPEKVSLVAVAVGVVVAPVVELLLFPLHPDATTMASPQNNRLIVILSIFCLGSRAGVL